MKMLRMILWMSTVFPFLFIVCLIGCPFYTLCCIAGEREVIESLVDRVGDKIKGWLIRFATKGDS